MLLNAAGGVYSEGSAGSFELAVRYVKAILGFWGVQNPETIIIEGHSQNPDQAAEIIATGVSKAATAAATF